MSYVICDIDGVLADLTHRLTHIQKQPKDWDAFFDACDGDAPICNMISVAQALSDSYTLVLLTGRPERVRIKTVEWLVSHGLDTFSYLLMRRDGDHRPDHLVKPERLDMWFRTDAAPGDVLCIFEDRRTVVDEWRMRGYLCLQNAPGEF